MIPSHRHGAGPLSATERQSWHERQRLPESSDVSPGGRYHSEAAGDRVRLSDRSTGEQRELPARPGVQQTAAAEDGRTVAFVSEETGGKKLLGLTRDGETHILQEGFGIYGMDLSPDGETVAFGSFFELKMADKNGVREVGRFPAFIEKVHYLESGSLLVQGRLNTWAAPVPAFWLVDPSGQSTFVADPEVAEQLAPGVRSGLGKAYETVFPMATEAERTAMLDLFGYCTPTYRVLSEDRQGMVFTVQSRMDPHDPHDGTYLIRTGSMAAPLRLEEGPDLLQGRTLSQVVWKGKEAAMSFANRVDAYPCVVGDNPADARLLPYPLSQRDEPMRWSPSGRYLAMEIQIDAMPAIYCFDTRTRNFFPVVTGSLLEGWEGERILARRPEDEEALELEPLPVDPRFGAGQLFGSRAPEEGVNPGVKVERDHLVVGGVRVPRRRG